MENTEKQSSISPLNLLGVAFVILKLLGFLDLSWWLVTLPFWFNPAFLFICSLAETIMANIERYLK